MFTAGPDDMLPAGLDESGHGWHGPDEGMCEVAWMWSTRLRGDGTRHGDGYVGFQKRWMGKETDRQERIGWMDERDGRAWIDERERWIDERETDR